ncbi:MAG: YajQ family cyclic di-GMP-binding protein [Actinobacteria bacterium RBG_16_67_10]|nr:MAG: YajQ family cyclic di-GMP-binding protein [Actinobacteria bacterium RBG_16_67_10]HLB45240.1 YajQ family cyclic di-GMP-binding protein [Candidatus Limnocylindrales bacterium]
MAGDVSFDVVSEFDHQELVNALDQARREIGTRYDFKGAKAELELGKDEIILRADTEFRAKAMRDLLESKAIRRGLSLKIFVWGTVDEAGGNTVRQRIGLRRGLPEDVAKKIVKLIRDDFPKLKSQIQGDAVRVSGKNKDDLQRLIARLRTESEAYPVPLQYQNYR